MMSSFVPAPLLVVRLLSTTARMPFGSRPRVPAPYAVASLFPMLCVGMPGGGNAGQFGPTCDCSQYQRRECMITWDGTANPRSAASTPAAAAWNLGYSSAAVGDASV